MSRKLFFFLLFVTLLGLGQPASAKTDIEFILDASGSMRAAMGALTQMEVAKQSIKTALDTVPADAVVALRVYAHRVEQADKAGSCVDSELMIPFGPLNKAAIAARVDSIQPKGYTPIAYSLEQAANDFGAERESEHVLVLVSDGEETCGGDPVKAVQGLIAKGFKVKVNAVGFNVDAKTQAQLQAIAQAGGGQYYDARDSAALATSLTEIAQKSFLVQKTSSVYGAEIKGGDSYETAVAITPGTEYRLNHHQRQNQFDYFYVDLKAGQALLATMNTREKGISIQGQIVTENTNPYAGFQIHDQTRKKIAGEELIGNPNLTKTAQALASEPQRLYLLIGSTYANEHKDHPFKVEVKNFFDADSLNDAGATPEVALPIEKGKSYQENYLMAGDGADFYRLNTTRGEPVVVKIIPENLEAIVRGVFYDDLRVELGKGSSANRGAGVRVTATATGPVTYLRVDRDWASADTKYSMQVEGAATSETAPAETAPSVTTTLETKPSPPPPPPPPPEPKVVVVEKVVEKIIEKPAQFKWTSGEALKMLGSFLGIGLLLGLMAGTYLGKIIFGKKPNKETTEET